MPTKNVNGVVTELTAEELAVLEVNRTRDNRPAEEIAEWNATQYQRDRNAPIGANAYPSIGDQLDMMWHDKKDGTTTWEDAIQAVKDAHQKP